MVNGEVGGAIRKKGGQKQIFFMKNRTKALITYMLLSVRVTVTVTEARAGNRGAGGGGLRGRNFGQNSWPTWSSGRDPSERVLATPSKKGFGSVDSSFLTESLTSGKQRFK